MNTSSLFRDMDFKMEFEGLCNDCSFSYQFFPSLFINFCWGCFQLKLLQTNNSYESRKKKSVPFHTDS